jgi:hypothetical protein
MTTTVNLRKLLHRKAWEFGTLSPSSTGNGSWIDGDKSDLLPGHDCTYFVNGVSGIFNYNADQDAWTQLPNSGIAGAFGGGSCGEFVPLGMLGGSPTSTASAGTTTTLTTNRTIARDLTGCVVRVLSGTGVGYEGAVAGITLGANAVLTVTPASAVAFDATTTFEIYSGSLWFFNAGSTAVGFSVYDRATNAWTAKSVTGLPTAWGTCGQLIGTPAFAGQFVTGGASAGAASALTTTKTLLLNQYANFQVRIAGGTGKGQVRKIASHTAGANAVLTTSTAWTVIPDATSTFVIEGDTDALYLLGNNAVTLYKYSISGNTWATLAPSAARAAAMGAGGTADWIDQVPTWGETTNGQNHYQSSIQRQNGRYIYSFRGAGSSGLDVYDIALNTWLSGLGYGNQMEGFSGGSCSVDIDGAILLQKEGTGRLFRFDVAKHVIEPYTTNPYPQSTTVEGDKMFVQTYKDGGTKLRFVYSQMHSRTELVRMLDI